MDRVLCVLKWSSCLVYLVDIIIVGTSFSEHSRNLAGVLQRLREAGLKLKPSKCKWCQKSVTFLGHIASEEGIAADPSKTAVVAGWPPPQSKRKMQQFLGLANYCRKFVKNFDAIAKPLHHLTEKSTDFKWTVECQHAFDALRACLISPPVLSGQDYSRWFVLDTDASDIGIGAVLSQVDATGSEVVIAYTSRMLSRPELRYCVTRKELLAAVEFIHHFWQYLLGRDFTLRTDHSLLVWLRNFKEPEGQLVRWLEKLQECSEYNILIIAHAYWICVPVYILCIYSCCALLLIKAGLYIGVRSGMDAQSQTADADHRPTRFSVRPPARFGKGVDFTLWIQRVELYLKEANIPNEKKGQELVSLLEDEAFRIVSQMGYLSDDAIDYTAVKKCLEMQFAPPGVELELQRQLHTAQQKSAESLTEFAACWPIDLFHHGNR